MTTEEEVLEAAKERLGMCVDADDDVLPGIVFGLKFGVAYGCTDGWLWYVDHGEGFIAERTEMPNAGNQTVGRQVVQYLSATPEKMYEMESYVVARMGGMAKTQLGLFDLTKLGQYGSELVWGAGDDLLGMVQIWTTQVDNTPVIHLRCGAREAALAACTPGELWWPTYDLPLAEVVE